MGTLLTLIILGAVCYALNEIHKALIETNEKLSDILSTIYNHQEKK